MILFTSVVPETYSFVLSEMMSMGLPVVCLDIGAQGHRVREYEKGIVCSDVYEMNETLLRLKKKGNYVKG